MAVDLPDWSVKLSPEYVNVGLAVVKDNQKVDSFSLYGKQVFVFGRNPAATDFTLEHPTVSRLHAAITFNSEGEVFICDLKSGHGTYINDKEVKPKEWIKIGPRDVIRFGQSTRRYSLQNYQGRGQSMKEGIPDGKNSGDDYLEDPIGVELEELHLPLSFGKAANKAARKQTDILKEHQRSSTAASLERQAREAEIAKMTASMMGPPPSRPQKEEKPVDKAEDQGKDNDDESESEEDDGPDVGPDPAEATPESEARELGIPVSHELKLSGHRKAVSTIAVDPAGARVCTGSLDYTFKLWDFAGMDRGPRSFREGEVEEGHVVVSLDYSPTGDRFIAATASSQPKIFDREGASLLQFIRGDIYKMDMANTSGHTKKVTGACWHPHEKNFTLTCSEDGSLRIWDLNGKCSFSKLINRQVIKARSKRGTRVGVTSCSLTKDGRSIAGTTADGQVQVWDIRASYSRPGRTIPDAHDEGSHISCIVFSPDGSTFATRADDDMLKLWDMRNMKNSLKVLPDVASVHETSNCAFSPDGTVLVAGTAAKKGSGQFGMLKFHDVLSAETSSLYHFGVTQEQSVISVYWHSKIKQILAGTSGGVTHCFYDPLISNKGAMLSAGRISRPKTVMDWVPDMPGKIVNPHSLPMFREGPTGKRKRDSERKDPIKSRKPMMPPTGPDVSGGNYTFTSQFAATKRRSTIREEDPREALLRQADKAAKAPEFVGVAYAASAPQGKVSKAYAMREMTLEQEEEELKKHQEELLK